MSSTNAALLNQAQAAIKTGQKDRARQLLQQATRLDPQDHRPWLYLAGLASSPDSSRAYLDRAALNPGDPTITRARAWVDGRLAEPPAAPETSSTERILPLRGSLTWTLAGGLLLILLIALSPVLDFLWPLRLLLGLVFVLLIPGYWLITALFPRAADLDGIERLALSIGLSVAVIAPLALILDWLPFGIRLWPIITAYALYFAFLIPLALYRRSRLTPADRFTPRVEIDLRGWWAAQDRVNRIIYFVLLGAFLLASFSAAAILLLPKPGEHFTEFYMLGPEGLAENFPRQAAPGEPLTVTLGLTNLENAEHTYHVEVWAVDPFSQDASLPRERSDRGQLVAETPALTISAGETLEWPINWSMPAVGEDQQVEFLLYIDTQPDPYRQLRLWLDVLE